MNIEKYLLTPPVVFILMIILGMVLATIFSFFSYKGKGDKASGKAYACGEDNYDIYAQPDYSYFFPFAYFFTIAHVATLILATIPNVTPNIFFAAILYIVAVVIGLFVLLWR
jgi:hypothetical protein